MKTTHVALSLFLLDACAPEAGQAIGAGSAAGASSTPSTAGGGAAGSSTAAAGASGGSPGVGGTGTGGTSAGNGSDGRPGAGASASAGAAANAGAGSSGGGSSAGGPSGGAGGSGPTTSCSGASYAFCEDFEAATLSPVWTERHTPENSTELTRQKARAGLQSFHFAMNAAAQGGGSATITHKHLPTSLGAHYFGRAYYFIDALPTADVHVNLLSGRGALGQHAADEPLPALGGTVNYAYGAWGQTLFASYFVFEPWQDWWKHSDTVWPTNRWLCVEWEMDRDADSMRLWLDGVAQGDQTVVGESDCCPGKRWDAPTFSEQMLGWDYFQTTLTKSWNVWLDEVALDQKRVGCLP